ncbi:MAG: hypothetical protein AB8G26_10560 [Ilumatobacter sp.]
MTVDADHDRSASTRTIGGVGSLIVVLIGLLVAVAACGSAESAGPEQPTFDYLIPAGAGELIESGQTLDILPGELIAELNDTIQIVNADDEAHQVGPWFVGPGETLRQRFNVAGVFEGSCSVHESGAFKVVVARA